MPRIPEEEIDRIKSSTDILALVRSRGIDLQKHGSRDYRGRCPFHDDGKTPNLIVSPGKGLYHCMACGAAGNAIQFIERFDGVSFRHAVELLSEGSTAYEPRNGAGRKTKHATGRKLPPPVTFDADDQALLNQVADYYHERLAGSQKALAYLERRGLADDALVGRFRIGFADRTLGLRLPTRDGRNGATIRDQLQKIGIYRKSGHEHLNGSIVVPITDAAGNVTEMYGRKVTPRLRKGTKDHLYLPGPHRGIFNADALKQREIILCESIFDALTFIRHGMDAATCIYGNQGFTDELLEAIKAANLDAVRIAYDADDAGERAAKRDTARLQAIGVECYRIKFPLGEDANSFGNVTLHPDAASRLKKAVRSAQWLNAAPSSNGHSTSTPSSLAAKVSSQGSSNGAAKKESIELVQRGEHWHAKLGERTYRVSGLEKNGSLEVMKITLRLSAADALHVDQIDLCRDPDRRRFIERAAEETNLDPILLKRDLAKLLLSLEEVQEERLASPLEAETTDAPAMTEDEREAALALLKKPNLPAAIAEAFEACGIAGEDTNKLTAYLACTSRLLQKPLAVIIQSTSAAGKSTLMEAVLACFPGEAQIKYSAMTGQSLYYLGETNLAHKILAIVEEEGAEKASYALKLLQSEGELTIASTGKDPHTGRMKTEEYHVEGPVMIFLTTTAIDIDEELMNRCLVLTVDESRAQTERIHELQRKARTLEGLLARETRKETLRTLQNAQRLLKPYAIVNDFAAELTFTAEKTRSRRDHEKYLTLIDAITLLHQHQREVETHQIHGRAIAFIRATREDIALANRLAPEVLGRSLDELPPQTRRLLEAVKAIVRELPKKQSTFTRRKVREKTGWSATQVKLHLDRLAELEYVGTRYARAGIALQYELLIDASEPEGIAHVGLLEPERLAAV